MATIKQQIGVGVGLLMAGAAIGRYTLPAKIVVKTQVVKSEAAKETNHSTIIVTETKKPDGTDTIVTKTQDNVQIDSQSKEQDDTSSTTTYNTQRWSINALAAGSLQSRSVTYGASVTYRILGPFSVGGFGLTNGTAGVSFGITF